MTPQENSFLIVGAGILGLSLAEYVSRKPENNVTIVYSTTHSRCSEAAAANLQTKGQRFARDPHFDLKLQGKKQISQWLKFLLSEHLQANKDSEIVERELQTIFCEGKARESFDAQVAQGIENHLNRIFQNPQELANRNLAPQPIQKESQYSILIDEEQWVSAEQLLLLLENILRKRGVLFEERNISSWESLREFSFQHLVLAPGVGILNLVKILNFPDIPEMRKVRLSLGTVYSHSYRKDKPQNIVFWEHTFSAAQNSAGSNLNTKVTLTFPQSKKLPIFATSVTHKIQMNDVLNWQNGEPALVSEYQEKETNFLNRVFRHPYFENKKDCFENEKWSKKTGIRIGFGHSELFCKTWNAGKFFDNLHVKNNLQTTIPEFSKLSIVCGAHKSGFCFAPVIGSMCFEQKN